MTLKKNTGSGRWRENKLVDEREFVKVRNQITTEFVTRTQPWQVQAETLANYRFILEMPTHQYGNKPLQ